MFTESILIVLVGTSTIPKHVIEVMSLFNNVSIEKLSTSLLLLNEFLEACHKHLFCVDRYGSIDIQDVHHVFIHYDVTCVTDNGVLNEISDALSKIGVVCTITSCHGSYQFDNEPETLGINHDDYDKPSKAFEDGLPF